MRLRTLGTWALLLAVALVQIVEARCVTTVVLNGKKYYVDEIAYGRSAQIWLRVQPNTCSLGDFKVMDLQATTTKLGRANQIVCRAKTVYNAGKTVAGCGSVIGSGVCLAASAPLAEAPAALCTGLFAYAYMKGVADCIDGVSTLIASALGREQEWAFVGTSVGISTGQWGYAIDKAIDMACADARSGK